MTIGGGLGWLSRIWGAIVVAVALALAIPATAGAEVLVSAIEPTVACGRSVSPGIWYQSFSGGPRGAKMTIKTRRGVVVWRKDAKATTTWRYWHFRGACGTSYVLTYKIAGGTLRFPFRVRRA